MIDLNKLSLIVAREFADIVVGTEIIRDKLRVALKDGSYVDFWWSASILGRFAHHWERTHVDGTIYRHDNMPHPAAKHLDSFPQHYHEGNEDNVVSSYLPVDSPEASSRAFLNFIAQKLSNER